MIGFVRRYEDGAGSTMGQAASRLGVSTTVPAGASTTTVERMALRVVFADDNYLVREGVSALLSSADDIEVVDVVADSTMLIAAVSTHSPDAVLTDIRMPPTHTDEGIEAARRINAEHPGVGVVVLSQYVEEDYAFDLLVDGVAGRGYLLKERVSDLDELVRALHEVARGGSVLAPLVVEALLTRRADDAPMLGLTDREREVLAVMATGRNNATIAKTLFMSDRAVEKHIGAVFQKLGLVEEHETNRRVMAVLAYLEASGPRR
jgi:DNA-binding NarL/FixJ family response regulator